MNPILSYYEKIEILRGKKEQETQKKLLVCPRQGVFDTDDKGFVLPPDGWEWKPKTNTPDNDVRGAAAWADNFYSLMCSHPPYIDPYCSLAGAYMIKTEWSGMGRWPAEWIPAELAALHRKYELYHGIGGRHHMHHDVGGIGLKLGWSGILEKIRHYKGVHGGDPGKLEFLQAEETVVLGIQQWILRNAQAAADAAAQEADPDLRQNLQRMARMNYKLASDKPDTFLEACQWLVWFLLQSAIFNGQGAGGALDIMLLPYFTRDIAEGALSEEEATYHLACLFLKDTVYFEIGGTWPDGSDRTNRVSWLALEALHWLKIPAAVCLRVHENIPRAFVRQAIAYMFEDKCGNPSFLGDACMVSGFMKNGYSEETARTRYKTGCNWCALPGTEYPLNDTIKINMAKVFEVAYLDMADGGEKSVARLWDVFAAHLDAAIGAVKRSIDLHLKRQHEVMPELALDFMCHGPVERGLDASNGGVDFYNIGIDFCALATVADSFAALERAIEDEKAYAWDEVEKALKTDYSGLEGMRLYLRATPHYGYGGTRADGYALELVELMTSLTKKCPTPGGVNCIPGMFSWANTIGFGKSVMATPNGRKAGEPISHGANPEPGFRESGALTAMGIAVASVQPNWGNPAPIQLEIDPMLAKGEQGIDNITDFMMTYCNDLGGSLVNINIIDREKILDAYDHPEKYPDLVVRITGFSVYFCTLSPEFKKLVIERIIAN